RAITTRCRGRPLSSSPRAARVSYDGARRTTTCSVSSLTSAKSAEQLGTEAAGGDLLDRTADAHLAVVPKGDRELAAGHRHPHLAAHQPGAMARRDDRAARRSGGERLADAALPDPDPHEIGRASCRERVWVCIAGGR